MCGRYVRRSHKQKLADWFHADGDLSDLPMPDEDYNVAPTTYQPIIRQSRDTGARELVLARWGLVPFFSKSMQDVKGLTTINARAETITTTRTWREPFRRRRCLVPADAFYEWPKDAKPPRQPYAFALNSGEPFAFAGVWDAWKDQTKEAGDHWLQSFAIVTTKANEVMARIHPRMPVMLHARDYDRWLDREATEQLPVDLLRTFESEAIEMHQANPLVNNFRNNGPEMLIKPPASATLFDMQ